MQSSRRLSAPDMAAGHGGLTGRANQRHYSTIPKSRAQPFFLEGTKSFACDIWEDQGFAASDMSSCRSAPTAACAAVNTFAISRNWLHPR